MNTAASGPKGAQGLPLSWREAALDRVLTLTALAAPVVLLLFVVLRPPPRFDAATVVVAGVVVALVALRLAPRPGLRLRTWMAAGVLVAAGLASLVELGPLVGPGLGLSIATVVVALVLGRWAGLGLTVLTALLIAAGGWLVVAQVLPGRPAPLDPGLLANWLRAAAIYALLTSLLVVLVDHVVCQLSRQYSTASTAVARLEKEVQERKTRERAQAQGLHALQALAVSDVVESGSLHSAFARITEASAEALEIERVSIWLLDEAGARLHCFDLFERTAGRHSRGLELAAADYPAYFAALADERAVAASDAQNDPRTRALTARYLGPRGIGAILDAPIRYGERVVGVACHEHVGPPRPFAPEAIAFAGSIGDFAARALAAAERARQEQALRLAYEQLVQLYRRLEGAKEEERRELAHELHDELGQSLTAIKLRLQMLTRRPGTSTVTAELGESLAVIDELIARVRRISVDLRPPLLDEVGLGPALRTYLDAQAALSGLPIVFDGSSMEGRLPAEIEIGAFRVVQEGVTNALRHAGAASLRVELRREPEGLHLRVRDDGRGFDVDAARQEGTRGERFGLVGMRERLRGLGGSLEIRSRPGQGTEVEARLPVE